MSDNIPSDKKASGSDQSQGPSSDRQTTTTDTQRQPSEKASGEQSQAHPSDRQATAAAKQSQAHPADRQATVALAGQQPPEKAAAKQDQAHPADRQATAPDAQQKPPEKAAAKQDQAHPADRQATVAEKQQPSRGAAAKQDQAHPADRQATAAEKQQKPITESRQEGIIGHLIREAKSPGQHEKDWHEKDYRAKTIAETIRNEAHDDKKSLDQSAKEAIQKIIKEYYPEYANRYKINVEYKGEKEEGLHTTVDVKNHEIKIEVGKYFIEHIDEFARRVNQVGHEMDHVRQQEQGMGGKDRQHEREFLAHGKAAQEPEKPGTGTIPPGTRLYQVNKALEEYKAMPPDAQKRYEAEEQKLERYKEQLVEQLKRR